MKLKELMAEYKRYDFEVVVKKTYKIEVHEKSYEEAEMVAWMYASDGDPIETVTSVNEVKKS
jgi:hypothetical protein